MANVPEEKFDPNKTQRINPEDIPFLDESDLEEPEISDAVLEEIDRHFSENAPDIDEVEKALVEALGETEVFEEKNPEISRLEEKLKQMKRTQETIFASFTKMKLALEAKDREKAILKRENSALRESLKNAGENIPETPRIIDVSKPFSLEKGENLYITVAGTGYYYEINRYGSKYTYQRFFNGLLEEEGKTIKIQTRSVDPHDEKVMGEISEEGLTKLDFEESGYLLCQLLPGEEGDEDQIQLISLESIIEDVEKEPEGKMIKAPQIVTKLIKSAA